MIINRAFIYFLIVAGGIFSVILLGLGPALIGGIATYLLITSLHSYFNNGQFKDKMSDKFKVNISMAFSFLFMFIFAMLVYKSLHSIVVNNRLESMLSSLVLVIDQIRDIIQQKFAGSFLSNINTSEDLKKFIVQYISQNGKTFINISNTIFQFLLLILLGMIIGSIFTYSKLYAKHILKVQRKDLNSDYDLLIKYIRSFSEKFKLILYSQFWVAIVNTTASFLYLMVALPMFGIDIPYKGVAVVITFIASLIPIVGNLLCNVLITALSLSAGIKVAVASLVYLIVIHKFEYIIIAKVVGEKIQSSIWEILCAIIIFERIFGLAGMVLAPVIYTYIKEELKNFNFFGCKNLDKS